MNKIAFIGGKIGAGFQHLGMPELLSMAAKGRRPLPVSAVTPVTGAGHTLQSLVGHKPPPIPVQAVRGHSPQGLAQALVPGMRTNPQELGAAMRAKADGVITPQMIHQAMGKTASNIGTAYSAGRGALTGAGMGSLVGGIGGLITGETGHRMENARKGALMGAGVGGLGGGIAGAHHAHNASDFAKHVADRKGQELLGAARSAGPKAAPSPRELEILKKQDAFARGLTRDIPEEFLF
jgi:hypothetical protein